jgi:hypothetical protein
MMLLEDNMHDFMDRVLEHDDVFESMSYFSMDIIKNNIHVILWQCMKHVFLSKSKVANYYPTITNAFEEAYHHVYANTKDDDFIKFQGLDTKDKYRCLAMLWDKKYKNILCDSIVAMLDETLETEAESQESDSETEDEQPPQRKRPMLWSNKNSYKQIKL